MTKNKNHTKVKRLFEKKTFTPCAFHSVSVRTLSVTNKHSRTQSTHVQKSPPWACDKGCVEACAERFSALKRRTFFSPERPTLTSLSLQSITRPFQKRFREVFGNARILIFYLSIKAWEELSLSKSHLGWFFLAFGEGKAIKGNMSIFWFIWPLKKGYCICILTILWSFERRISHAQPTYILYIHDWMNLNEGYSHTFFPLVGLCYGRVGTYTFKIPRKSNGLTVCAEPCANISWISSVTY